MTCIAKRVVHIIEQAEKNGVVIDNGNVIDLLADNVMLPLDTLRRALAMSAIAHRFPQATRPRL